jgi:hypothetical protein
MIVLSILLALNLIALILLELELKRVQDEKHNSDK